MLGLVTTPNGKTPMELREVPEPEPQHNEAVVAVHAFSLNRGELRSIRKVGSRARMSPVSCCGRQRTAAALPPARELSH